jgi:hypothetical protein
MNTFCSGREIRFVSLAALLLTTVLALPQEPSPWITDAQREQILHRVRSVMPEDWTVTQTLLNRTPGDWYTLDGRGFEIDGRTGDHAVQIWFLPKDWIGIRQPRADRLRLVYWEGVLLGSDYKTITNTEDVSIQRALQRLGMNTPSLVNSGWDQSQIIFKDHLSEVDKKTLGLVGRFCEDTSCKQEAAYSLIVLGVPAISLTLECAQHFTGEAQGFCVSALGYWKGQESVRVLSGVITEPSTSPLVQKYAAMALNSIGDASAGSALTKSLQIISDSEAASQVAEALGRIHYKLAAPQLLSRMEREPNGAYQVHYAKALATLRYTPAIPAIERLCKTKKLSGSSILLQQQDTYLGWVFEIALMRLRESWGAPSNGIRLLLLPPDPPAMSGPARLVAVIENVGDQDLNILATHGYLIIDGKEYADRDAVVRDQSLLRSKPVR